MYLLITSICSVMGPTGAGKSTVRFLPRYSMELLDDFLRSSSTRSLGGMQPRLGIPWKPRLRRSNLSLLMSEKGVWTDHFLEADVLSCSTLPASMALMATKLRFYGVLLFGLQNREC